ncbi:MAG: HAD family hydrolase [Candidatus Cloacimonetes bacterium]|nr:HAD family hydrolase [Candidatus Cloacimonadota bacterium]
MTNKIKISNLKSVGNSVYQIKNGDVFINPEKIKLIIFDKDGTLSDLNMWLDIIKNRAKQLGKYFDLSQTQIDEIIRKMGLEPRNNKILDIAIITQSRPETENIVANELVKLGIKQKTAFESTHRIFGEVDKVTDLIAIARPLGNLKRLFTHFSEAGIKIAVATSDIAERCEKIMEAFGVSKFISAISGADSIKNDKPAPDMVHKICDMLKIPQEKTAVVGDNIWDHQMAKSAGCPLSIGVLTGKDDYKTMIEFADCVVNTIENINIINEKRKMENGERKEKRNDK